MYQIYAALKHYIFYNGLIVFPFINIVHVSVLFLNMTMFYLINNTHITNMIFDDFR